MGKYEEVLEEGGGPRVPSSRGPKVPGSQGPRYLKLTFKYELDSKEGPSCSFVKLIALIIKYQVRINDELLVHYHISVSSSNTT